MSATQRLRAEIARIGYSAIVTDYVFSDVFASPPRDRTAPLVAFTHTPPSYRNAALAVVADPEGRGSEQIASVYRALGAPLLFLIEGDDITAWQVRSQTGPRVVAHARQDQLSALFSERRGAWSPRSIQDAKSLGQINRSYQLDFVDAGLLPAIEGEIHARLDQLLRETLDEALSAQAGPWRIDEQLLFQTIFRFLAAKILRDRGHKLAKTWDVDDITTVLDSISQYYRLPVIEARRGTPAHEIFGTAWRRLRDSINFQNISADDLAFVYENTLVTPKTRKELGTHSTPWQVVEYVVSRLDFGSHSPDRLSVYEPFAGASVFLVSVLRHLRELLPIEWTDRQRHDFLITRLFGDEIDAFAVEVSQLSLILADYPNHNGWQVTQMNLFEADNLAARMRAHNVIVCNPPFEAFSPEQREWYPIAKLTHLKPSAVLNAALNAHPLALGFVMPRAFIVERQFAVERSRVERLYGSIELVELPDRTFRESEEGAALLIAREPRPPAPPVVKLRSTEVSDHDRLKFLRSGEGANHRDILRVLAEEPTGDLWIPRLRELWESLNGCRRLGTVMRATWGLQWTYDQSQAFSLEPRPGFREGLFNARGSKQFVSNEPVNLDYRRQFVRRGYGQPWQKSKLIINAGRRGRGGWRISAIVDTRGLLYSQQFYGLWPLGPVGKDELLTLAAILNGPLANAYIATHSPASRFRKTAVEHIPIPARLPLHVAALVREYVAALTATPIQAARDVSELLMRIDAAVLEAYDLPPRLEREMLEFFRGQSRPVGHDWSHWFPENFRVFVPLHEYVSGAYKQATGNWLSNIFEPLSEDEAVALREYR